MAFSIGTALRDGLYKVASRTGAILIAAYLALNVVFLVAFNGMMKTIYAQSGADAATASFGPALNAPLPVTGVLVAISVLLSIYLSIVALRTFVAGDRDSFRREHLTEGIVFAILNMVVGGLVQGIIVTVGFVFLVIPGFFLTVALLFMNIFIVVENENFVAAMRRSWNTTDGSRMDLFLLGVAVVALGMVFGVVIGIGAIVGAAAGVDPAIISVLYIAVFIPASLCSTGILASAFNQLRDDELDEPGTGTATSDPSSSVA